MTLFSASLFKLGPYVSPSVHWRNHYNDLFIRPSFLPNPWAHYIFIYSFFTPTIYLPIHQFIYPCMRLFIQPSVPFIYLSSIHLHTICNYVSSSICWKICHLFSVSFYFQTLKTESVKNGNMSMEKVRVLTRKLC